jgi:hypothetical protein
MADFTRIYTSASTAACLALLLAGCGGGGGSGGDSTATPAQTNGTLVVSMTDAPSCGFDAVNVTVNKVRVHQSASAAEDDAGWTDITLNPARRINLLDLSNGIFTELGQTPLTPGHYTQLRLMLDPNSGNGLANSVLPSGSADEVSLDTPSAVRSGIKLVNEFDVAAGQRVEVMLDFDACKSIVTRGNGKYALKPVVKVVPTVVNGVEGYVSTALLPAHVQVSAQQNGQIVSSTVPDNSGKFFLSRLAPGSYDVVITADERPTAVIGAVPVASTPSPTTISTSAAPIALQTAATPSRNISGNIAFAPSSNEAAYVAARQTLPTGATVTIKYKLADAETGDYVLASLPTVAPLYVQYNATQTLAFAAQPGTTPGTGKYVVQASATGYQTKTVSVVDIGSASQTGVNATLTP